MSLELVAPGSLSKPGPVGRLVRFLLAILCLYALWGLINIASDFVENPIGLLPNLGISFLLAATLATPGCEMRAIPEFIGKITHRESKEHLCPISILSGIDQWEKRRSLET
jgi:hypothetical protein